MTSAFAGRPVSEGRTLSVLVSEAGRFRMQLSEQAEFRGDAIETIVLERTGHLGSITRPDAFASLLREFVEEQRHAAA